MDTERYERIAKQVNAAVGSDLTAADVESIANRGAYTGPVPLTNAARWLARHLLNDE